MAATAPLGSTTGTEKSPWQGFRAGLWQKEINVRDFIQQNCTPYEGDGSFLKPATARTRRIWEKLQALFVEERRKGVLDISQVPGSITAYAPGYIDRDNEIIVGLQTEAPLKRGILPKGGIRMVYLDRIDLVLLGIKTWGRERHRALTGRDPEPTLEFARRLAARGQPVWIRFVLVPGLTDDAADLAHIAGFAAGLGNVQRVEVLPFHQMGRFKWETLGIRYALENTEPPSPAAVAQACGIFRAQGLRAD